MRSFKLLPLILSFVALTTAVHARADNFNLATGYLDDFGYQLTEIGTRGAEEEFQKLERGTDMASICLNRANLWAYDMDRRKVLAEHTRLNSAKIFVFFTPINQASEGKDWWFHVAPVVMADGQLKVLDGSFPNGINGPVSIETWNSYFTQGYKCKEIRATDTALIDRMRNNAAFPSVDPATGQKADCYYQLVPMYYLSPLSIAWHLVDSKLPKNESKSSINLNNTFTANGWLKDDLIGNCTQGLGHRERWCKKNFLKFGKWDDGAGIAQ